MIDYNKLIIVHNSLSELRRELITNEQSKMTAHIVENIEYNMEAIKSIFIDNNILIAHSDGIIKIKE